MSIRLDKPYSPLDRLILDQLPGQTGVFELADHTGAVICIGYAGGRSLFGLRSAIPDTVSDITSAADDHAKLPDQEKQFPALPAQFRYEVTTAYLTRYQELMMLFQFDKGELPPFRVEQQIKFGRLSPA